MTKFITLFRACIATTMVLILLLSGTTVISQPYELIVNASVSSPVNPYVMQMMNPASQLMVTLQRTNTNANIPLKVKLWGKIERISPLPASLSLDPGFRTFQSISINPGVGTTTILNSNDITQAFGNFSKNNIVNTGVNVDDFKSGSNFKLGEGHYKFCIVAYDYNTTGYTKALSDPNNGCTYFDVCYAANPPDLIMPVNTIGSSYTKISVTAASPLNFVWTVPAGSCGLNLNNITYDLTIVKMLAGQTETDAVLHNSLVFQRTDIMTTSFQFDTLQNPYILKQGETYAVRIKAKSSNLMNYVEFNNGGYSKIGSFVYVGATVPVVANTINVSDACSIPLPTNKNDLNYNTNLNGQDVTVGAFTLHINNANRNANFYTGDGYVNWTPMFNHSIKLAVKFTDIRINTDKQVYDGDIQTNTNNSSPLITELNNVAINQISQLDNFLNNNTNHLITFTQPNAAALDCPLGLDNNIAGQRMTIAITSIVFKATGTNMSMLFNLNIPEANDWLSLAGSNFCIKPDGFMFDKGGVLYLPKDKDLSIGGGTTIKLKGFNPSASDTGTYLAFDNNGFKMMNVKASISLPSSIINVNTKGTEIADLNFRFVKWSDWVASIHLDPFYISGLNGFNIHATDIYYDHSASQNPPGIVFPIGYKGNNTTSFEGFYIKTMLIDLPSDFKTFDNSSSNFTSQNLIIDSTGISTKLSANKLIEIGKGNLGGWAFSLDTIQIDIVSNTFQYGGMVGKIKLPVSNGELKYSCNLRSNNNNLSYVFTIKPENNIGFDIWGGGSSLTLANNSNFTIDNSSGSFIISASINGTISLIDTKYHLPEIKVENFGFSNVNGFEIRTGTWSLASPPKSLAGFPVNLISIEPYFRGNELGLKTSLGITLGDASVLSGTTTFTVKGGISILTTRAPTINFIGIDLDTISVHGRIGPIHVDGTLAFYNHDVKWGDGMKGSVKAIFPMVGGIQSTLQFGNVNGYSYWYVDASLRLPVGIPIVGPIVLSGFGGGAYGNMELQDNNQISVSNVSSIQNIDSVSLSLKNNTPGTTCSGLNFVPSSGHYGIRAMIAFSIVSSEIVDASATFTAEINNGGLSKININGDATAIKEIHATMNMTLDFEHSVYDFSVNANATIPVIGLSAQIPIYFHKDPNNWHFYIGDPYADRIELKLVDIDYGFIKALLKANAYFAVGNDFHGLPPLPKEITDYINVGARDASFKQMLTLLSSGSGIMTGASVSVDVSLNIAIFYANIKGGLGFDVFLGKTNFNCGKYAPAGLDGLYGMGQFYAYLLLDVGVHIDVWFYTGDCSLCTLHAAALLQGGLPNPMWAEGDAHIDGSILDDMISFSTNLHMSIGDKCMPPEIDPLRDMKIISDVGPKGDKTDPYCIPFATTTSHFNTEFEISLPPSERIPNPHTRTFRFVFNEFSLIDASRNEGIKDFTSLINYNSDNTSAYIVLPDALHGTNKYTGTVVCKVEEFRNKIWGKPVDSSGNEIDKTEKTTFDFTTSRTSDAIDSKHIVYMYPSKGQKYVLKNEFSGKCRIELFAWPDSILPITPPNVLNNWQMWAVFIPENNASDVLTSNFHIAHDDNVNTSSSNAGYIEIPFPAGLLNNTTYQVKLYSSRNSNTEIRSSTFNFNTPINNQIKSTFISIVNNVRHSISNKDTTSVNVKNRTTSMKVLAIPKPIFSFKFSTSKFNTLAEKLNSYGEWKIDPNPVVSTVVSATSSYSGALPQNQSSGSGYAVYANNLAGAQSTPAQTSAVSLNNLNPMGVDIYLVPKNDDATHSLEPFDDIDINGDYGLQARIEDNPNGGNLQNDDWAYKNIYSAYQRIENGINFRNTNLYSLIDFGNPDFRASNTSMPTWEMFSFKNKRFANGNSSGIWHTNYVLSGTWERDYYLYYDYLLLKNTAQVMLNRYNGFSSTYKNSLMSVTQETYNNLKASTTWHNIWPATRLATSATGGSSEIDDWVLAHYMTDNWTNYPDIQKMAKMAYTVIPMNTRRLMYFSYTTKMGTLKYVSNFNYGNPPAQTMQYNNALPPPIPAAPPTHIYVPH